MLAARSGVDGVYTAGPRTEPDATRLEEVSYLGVLNRGLKAMDATAITLCMDNKLPIVVFDLLGKGNIGPSSVASRSVP